MKNLKDLLSHQLKLLYSCENEILTELPAIIDRVNDKSLKKAIECYLNEKKNQKQRLEKICKDVNYTKSVAECVAIKGLIVQLNEFMEYAKNPHVFNAGLIAEFQRIAHFQICAYGTAVCYAKELGLNKIAYLLQQSLNEAYNTNDKLGLLAQVVLNYKAIIHTA